MDWNNMSDRVMIGMTGLFGSMIYLVLKEMCVRFTGTIDRGSVITLIYDLLMPLAACAVFVFSFYVLFKEFMGLCKRSWNNKVKKQSG